MHAQRLLAGIGVAGLFLVGSAGPAGAVVFHPATDALTVPGPSPDVVGRWNANASAVAIGPNHIVSTRHQLGGVGTQVVFGGTTYVVVQDTPILNNDLTQADLRVARIETLGGAPANLTAFTPVRAAPVTTVTDFTLGGFGRGRGTPLSATLNGVYGYEWAAEGNTNLRFGRNTIETTGLAIDDRNDADPSNDFFTAVLGGDFDGPGAGITGEAMPALFDSGGGWFVEASPGVWEVAALSRGVGRHPLNIFEAPEPPEPFDRSLFASRADASLPAPDPFDGVRLSTYATAINAAVPEPAGLALLGAAGALLAGRRRR